MEGYIRTAGIADVETMVALSEQKRLQYQSYQPLFWRKADDSREKQTRFLTHQLSRENVIALVYEAEGRMRGFVIAALVPSPPVYAAGLTCSIDDYCVQDHDWAGVGQTLLDEVSRQARERGAVQAVVVCGHLDQPQREMLSASGHGIASEWWVKPL